MGWSTNDGPRVKIVSLSSLSVSLALAPSLSFSPLALTSDEAQWRKTEHERKSLEREPEKSKDSVDPRAGTGQVRFSPVITGLAKV